MIFLLKNNLMLWILLKISSNIKLRLSQCKFYFIREEADYLEYIPELKLPESSETPSKKN